MHVPDFADVVVEVVDASVVAPAKPGFRAPIAGFVSCVAGAEGGDAVCDETDGFVAAMMTALTSGTTGAA